MKSDMDKVIIGISSFCGIALLYLIITGIIVPDNTFLSLKTNNIQINDKQEELIIEGVTEPYSKVYIDNKDLNLNRIPINVQKNGSFEYKIKIPPQITDTDVSVNAKAKGKNEVKQDVQIQRPLTYLNPQQKISYKENRITIEGKSEPEASIVITSNMTLFDLQSYEVTALDNHVINTKSLKADSNGNFRYTFISPPNYTSAYFNVTAKVMGKRSTTQFQNLTRKAIVSPISSIFETGNSSKAIKLKYYNGKDFKLTYPQYWAKRSYKDAGKDCRLFLKYKKNVECTIWHYRTGKNFGNSIGEYNKNQDIYIRKWWGGTPIYEQKINQNGATGIRTVYKCRQNPLFSSDISTPFYLDRTTITRDNVNVFELQIMASKNYYEKNGYIIQKTVYSFKLK